jgi:hypothetical protein
MQANATKCFENDEGSNERQYSGERMKLLAALIAVYLSTAPACAHDHYHPELKGWFEGLQSGRGACCDGKDALHLSDVGWGRHNKEDSHIRVRVPKDADRVSPWQNGYAERLIGSIRPEILMVQSTRDQAANDFPGPTQHREGPGHPCSMTLSARGVVAMGGIGEPRVVAAPQAADGKWRRARGAAVGRGGNRQIASRWNCRSEFKETHIRDCDISDRPTTRTRLSHSVREAPTRLLT